MWKRECRFGSVDKPRMRCPLSRNDADVALRVRKTAVPSVRADGFPACRGCTLPCLETQAGRPHAMTGWKPFFRAQAFGVGEGVGLGVGLGVGAGVGGFGVGVGVGVGTGVGGFGVGFGVGVGVGFGVTTRAGLKRRTPTTRNL